MKLSKTTKSNDQGKILKMISRNEELERNQGKWICTNKVHKNKKKYDRKYDKKCFRDNLEHFFCLRQCVLVLHESEK